MKQLTKMITAILVTFAVIGIANAAKEGAYVGGGLGGSTSNAHQSNVFGSNKGNSALGGRAFAGYNFNKYVGLEGNFARYSNTNSHYAKVELDALTVVAKGYLPIGENANVYGLAGAAERFSKVSYRGSNNTAHNHNLRPTYGAGASLDVAENLTTSVEYSRIQEQSKYSSPNADMMTINLAYNFG